LCLAATVKDAYYLPRSITANLYPEFVRREMSQQTCNLQATSDYVTEPQ